LARFLLGKSCLKVGTILARKKLFEKEFVHAKIMPKHLFEKLDKKTNVHGKTADTIFHLPGVRLF
jgi:hypothetical protein